MSVWWFDRLADLVPNHLISVDDPTIPRAVARPGDALPASSTWSRSRRSPAATSPAPGCSTTGDRRGLRHPAAGRPASTATGCPSRSSRPATKAAIGEHDENVTFDDGRRDGRRADGRELARADAGGLRARERHRRASAASSWPTPSSSSAGTRTGELVLGDEVLTPDSSRFWPADAWEPGRPQPCFDKQYVRDWLLSPASGWDRHVRRAAAAAARGRRRATRARYVEAYERLTGLRFARTGIGL